MRGVADRCAQDFVQSVKLGNVMWKCISASDSRDDAEGSERDGRRRDYRDDVEDGGKSAHRRHQQQQQQMVEINGRGFDVFRKFLVLNR